jgi:hypothetical protein
VSYVPATEDHVAACNNGGSVPADVLQLDFSRGFEKSRWNTIVLQRLYRQILDSHAEGDNQGLPDVSEGYLIGLLQGRLKQCREAWAKPHRRFSYELGRLETEEEASSRASNDDDIRLATVSSRSRRKAVSF